MSRGSFFVKTQTMYRVLLAVLGIALLAVGYWGTQSLTAFLNEGAVAAVDGAPEKKPADALRVTAPQSPAAVAPAPAPAKKAEENFFSDFRMERDRKHSQQVELLQEIVNNPNSPPGTRQEAQKKLMDLAGFLKKELELEKLIQVQGYKDCVVTMQAGSVSVVVGAKTLKQDEVAKLTELVKKTTGYKAEDIIVVNKG